MQFQHCWRFLLFTTLLGVGECCAVLAQEIELRQPLLDDEYGADVRVFSGPLIEGIEPACDDFHDGPATMVGSGHSRSGWGLGRGLGRFSGVGFGWRDKFASLWEPQEPLVGTSWLNRPYHVDAFIGGLFSDDPISGSVEGGSGLLGGIRVGVDMSNHWGIEARYAIADVGVGYPIGPAFRANEMQFLDLHWVYYPLGDDRWRPYFSLGAGYAQFDFFDAQGFKINEGSFHLPIGIGLKYFWQPWVAVRFDLHDNIALGGPTISTMQNLSLTAGLEWRFGGQRRNYYPYNPGRYLH